MRKSLRWVRERSSNNKSLLSGEQLPRMDRAGATQVTGLSDNDCFIKYIVNKVIGAALLLKSSWSATNAKR